MTLDELRSWHAKRAGWVEPGAPILRDDGTYTAFASWVRITDTIKESAGFKSVTLAPSVHDAIHPFPPTLDAADASFPPNWRWTRDYNCQSEWWAAFPKGWDGEEYPTVPDTGDKVFDLYALSKLAWEQEESNEH